MSQRSVRRAAEVAWDGRLDRVVLPETARREEAQRREHLLQQAAEWRRVAIAREYVDAVERVVVERDGSLDPVSKVGTWITWARGALEEMSPV